MTPVGSYRAAGRLAARNAGPLQGDISVPGDKSISHRALILGALAEGRTTVSGLLESADVLRTVAALRQFGIDVRRECADRWSIEGRAWRTPSQAIDCGNSGTTARLLMGAAAGQGVGVTLVGDSSLQSRPMRRVLDPLSSMGLDADGSSSLPVTLRPSQLGGTAHRLATPSAQVKSAILLAGLGTSDRVEVEEPMSCRDHTEIMLAEMGCEVRREGSTLSLGDRRRLSGTSIDVPADPSSAAFPLIAACVVPGSKVRAAGISVNPTRTGWIETMVEMGARISITNRRTVNGEPRGDLIAEHGPLRGVTVPAERIPSMVDEVPILAIAAACAAGRTIFEGVGELRVKESNRLDRMVTGLRANGVDAHVDGDCLIVEGRDRIPGGGRIDTHGDHRIAMSFLVLGAVAEAPVEVDEVEMIETSFPDFLDLMAALGARFDRPR
ncbi:3-phosphoshikimate 1-carboxyvinyltransferase [Sphingomonas rhizophila]|uniref:3-phosphoshikimate 1-carboxyvinyltransferase n=1 Tax=Sphingomonas rhizophila TaxID=2071607 RepID=A0A7G9SA50_9SPHN|nr:3-phosphoshikimate 1-carboxyvinyltransferase [Sphingomonas rhizophila]QNN64725.1 3-phosphoshikimate 1-carboxyvinyltransferase [Sphingomonas rhizophila]